MWRIPPDFNDKDERVDGGAGDMPRTESTPPAAVTDVAKEQGVGGAERAMRSDARRNYDRLVVAAREVLATLGGDASMEAIARQAGVGAGTLYRHFPKRIDLVEAVYRNDIDELMLAADKALANLAPWDALVSWLDAFLRYALGKQVFLTELREAFEKNPQLHLNSRERVEQGFTLVLDAAQRAGVARTDVNGSDLMQLISGMCTSPTLDRAQGERLLAMVLDGLRIVD
jgi:AcrR family transcriptional regulator